MALCWVPAPAFESSGYSSIHVVRSWIAWFRCCLLGTGQAAAPALDEVRRLAAAYHIACNMAMIARLIRAHLNIADKPSRRFDLPGLAAAAAVAPGRPTDEGGDIERLAREGTAAKDLPVACQLPIRPV